MTSRKVYVGMSGGVDSSLTAALLVEQGYDVTGVYMKNWTRDLPGMRCPWADDLADAKRVAVHLGIPFKVYDFQVEYKQRVVDYMIAEYQAGRTPNPDIMCNQEIKFRLFLDTALANGADMIATGHYARVQQSEESTELRQPGVAVDGAAPKIIFRSYEKNFRGGSTDRTRGPDNSHLLLAQDTKKDQTYFLYRITHGALARTLFPLGDLTKDQVRAMAAERGLSTAAKKDSQGICFVGSVGIKEFLKQFIETQPGAVIDRQSGDTVGRHDGAIFYTIGQRHGLNVGGGLPYYVVGKDMAKNEVYVSRDLSSDELWRDRITLSDIHWINAAPAADDVLYVRLRHGGPLLPAQLDEQTIILGEPRRAITAGQSAVIYRADECLGGGIVG